MSILEDSRKVMQDFLAPELRAIAAELAALGKRFDESEHRQEKFAESVANRLKDAEQRQGKFNESVASRFQEAEHRQERFADNVDKRFDGVDKRFDTVDKRFDSLDVRFKDDAKQSELRHQEMMTALSNLKDYNDLRDRLARLEERDANARKERTSIAA